MGNQASTRKKIDTGVAVYDRRTETVTVKQNPMGNDQFYKQDRFETKLHTVEEQVSVSRSTTFVADTREGAESRSSGYASMVNEVTLTSKTGALLRNFSASHRKGLEEEDKETLRRNFRLIKAEVDPECLIDCFIRDELLSENEREQINKSKTREDQVDALLRKLVRMQPEAFHNFCEYLTETGYGYVRKQMSDATERDHIEQTLHAELTLRIIQFKQVLIEELEPDAIAEILLEHDVISFEEYSKFRNQTDVDRMTKAEQVIEFVLMNQPRSLGVFIHALKLTKEGYCIDLLTNGQLPVSQTNEATGASEKVIKTCTTKPPRKLLKNVDRIEVKLVFQNNEISQQIVDELNRSDVKLAINASLSDEHLVFTKSKVGSVIIEIRVLKQDKRCEERALSTDMSICEVLNVFLRHSQTFRRCVDQDFEVKVLTSSSVDWKITRSRMQNNPKMIIEQNLALLEEELDALSLMKDKTLQEIFTKEEGTEILQIGEPRRRERTKRMLSTLLRKDPVAIKTFLNILKIKKKGFVTNCLQLNEDLSTHKKWTQENVTKLTQHMSPLTLEKYCITMGIINTNDFREIRSRVTRNNLILQNLLSKTNEEIVSFTRIMSWNQQIPRPFGPFKPGNQTGVEAKRTSNEKLFHIGQFKIVKENEILRPKATAGLRILRYMKAMIGKDTSSVSSCESGYASRTSIDSVDHERSPKGKTIYRNNTILSDDTPIRPKLESKWTAESGISSSFKSQDQLSTVNDF